MDRQLYTCFVIDSSGSMKTKLCITHPRPPGVAAADYVSNSSSLSSSLSSSFSYPLSPAHPCQKLLFKRQPMSEIAHDEFGRPPAMWLFWLISATRCSCYMQCLGREWVVLLGFLPVVYLS